MIPWTESARRELEDYFARIRKELESSGADPGEVVDDLRRHLDAEAANSGLSVVTEQDVRQMLAKLGSPEPSNEAPTALGEERPPVIPPRSRYDGFGSYVLFFLGVILPAVTLGIEAVTQMCAAAFFDPLPTVWHGLAIVLLVGVNGWTWSALRRGDARWRTVLGWGNGVAIAVAAFYAIRFLILLLPGFFALVVFGWGLLPWSPMLALIATLVFRRHLRRLGGQPDLALPGLWRGMLVGMVALLLAESPILLTRIGMQMAIAESSEERDSGIRWLRRVGKDELMLRACYGFGRGAQNMDVLTWVISGERRISAAEAREIYYRVAGRHFNSVPAPNVRTGRGNFAELNDWTWDDDLGGDRVGGRIRGLTLNSSRLDAVVDADAALSYTEWTLEFRNDSLRQREARAQVLLPPGGVVSRVTLWVNDEEREAAFAGRSHTREAYQKVAVQQRRDPILVTTAGPDRVLMQCFPIPARGGLMKVRLGVTAPLILSGADEGRIRLPLFLERNFSILRETPHTLWIESDTPLTTQLTELGGERTDSGREALHGRLADRDLSSPAAIIGVQRDPATTGAYVLDTRAEENRFIRQDILSSPVDVPSHLIVVLDGSATLQPHLEDIAAALAKLNQTTPLTVLAAMDGVRTLVGPDVRERGGAVDLQRRLRALRPVGGQDNVPALIEARSLASRTPGSAILWIHAPQPILMTPPAPLLQAYERNRNGPALYELSTETGADQLVSALNGLSALQSLPRLGSLEQDLQRLLDSWAGTSERWGFERRIVADAEEAQRNGATETSLHLARLWASQEVDLLRENRRVADAVKVAAQYQLVTPVSGAVVLETAEQYRDAGLTPVDPQTVPAIPEPTTLGLLLFAGVAWLLLRRRR